jgi:hypothetical protein
MEGLARNPEIYNQLQYQQQSTPPGAWDCFIFALISLSALLLSAPGLDSICG